LACFSVAVVTVVSTIAV